PHPPPCLSCRALSVLPRCKGKSLLLWCRGDIDFSYVLQSPCGTTNISLPSCFKLNPAGPLYTVGPDGQGGAENHVGIHGEQRRVRDFHELDISSAAHNVLSGGKVDVAGPR